MGAKNTAGSRLATLILVMLIRFRPSAKISSEPTQVSSSMAVSERIGASTPANSTIPP